MACRVPTTYRMRHVIYGSVCSVWLPLTVMVMWDIGVWSGAPCQWFSPAGIITTSPSLIVTTSWSVATLPVPSVTIRIWSPLCLWNLLREPALKWTMPKLKLLLSFCWKIVCRLTGLPVNKVPPAGSLVTWLILKTFMHPSWSGINWVWYSYLPESDGSHAETSVHHNTLLRLSSLHLAPLY